MAFHETSLVAGSHKRRDNRCAIAAVKLEEGTSVLLESQLQHVNSSLRQVSARGWNRRAGKFIPMSKNGVHLVLPYQRPRMLDGRKSS